MERVSDAYFTTVHAKRDWPMSKILTLKLLHEKVPLPSWRMRNMQLFRVFDKNDIEIYTHSVSPFR